MKTIVRIPFRFTKSASRNLVLLQESTIILAQRIMTLNTESLEHKTRVNQKSNNQDFHTH